MAAAKRLKRNVLQFNLPVRNVGGEPGAIAFGEMKMPSLGFDQVHGNPKAWHRPHALDELSKWRPSISPIVDEVKSKVAVAIRENGKYSPQSGPFMVADACELDMFCLEIRLSGSVLVCPLTFPYKTADRDGEIEKHAADIDALAKEVLASPEAIEEFLKGIKIPPAPSGSPWSPAEWPSICLHGVFVWWYSKLMRVYENWDLYRRASETYTAAVATFDPLSGIDLSLPTFAALVDLDPGQKPPGVLSKITTGKPILVSPESVDGTVDLTGRHGLYYCNMPEAEDVTPDIRELSAVAAEAAWGFLRQKQVDKALRMYAVYIPGRVVIIGAHLTAPAKGMTHADFVNYVTSVMRAAQRKYETPAVIFTGDTNLPEGQDFTAAVAVSKLPGFCVFPNPDVDQRKSTRKMRTSVSAQFKKRWVDVNAQKIWCIVLGKADVAYEWANPDEMLPSLNWPLDHSGLNLTVKIP